MIRPMLALVAVAFVTLAACSGHKPTNAASAEPGATPNCNGQPPVWTIARAKVFLLPGDALYGRTKHGAYVCRSEAQARGYRPARGPILKTLRSE